MFKKGIVLFLVIDFVFHGVFFLKETRPFALTFYKDETRRT